MKEKKRKKVVVVEEETRSTIGGQHGNTELVAVVVGGCSCNWWIRMGMSPPAWEEQMV